MENSSATNTEPSPDEGDSPFVSGPAVRDDFEAEPPRPLGHSMRVADIILLMVVVAVLTGIAVRGVKLNGATLNPDVLLRLIPVAVLALVGLLGTVLFERSVFASLYGAAVGAALGAAIPVMLWDTDATPSVLIGGAVILATGAMLGLLRRHGELAALEDDDLDEF